VSKKPENVFIKRVKNVNKNYYFQSIETYTTLGCADCFCIVNGRAFWLEFKHTTAKNLGLSEKEYLKWKIEDIKETRRGK